MIVFFTHENRADSSKCTSGVFIIRTQEQLNNIQLLRRLRLIYDTYCVVQSVSFPAVDLLEVSTDLSKLSQAIPEGNNDVG